MPLWVVFALFYFIAFVFAFVLRQKKFETTANLRMPRNVYVIAAGVIYIALAVAVPVLPTYEPPNHHYSLGGFNDVSEQYVGKTIAIMSLADGYIAFEHYMSTDRGADNLIRFNRTNVGVWERFFVEQANSAGWISLLADNGRYVRVSHNREDAFLVADAIYAHNWEQFKIFERDGKHYLITRENSIFITASSDKANIPAESRHPVREPFRWEEFRIIVLD
jgi:hypothetical protein